MTESSFFSGRPGLRILAAAIAVLALAEVTARAVESRLPEPLLWHNEEAQLKVDQINALRPEGAEVVFLGSSIMNAVEPALVTDALGMTAYNAWLTAGIPRLTEAWASHVVLPRLRPRLVVIGVNSFDLDANPPSRAVFHDAFLEAPAVERLLDHEPLLARIDRWIGERSTLWGNRETIRSPSTLLGAVRGTSAALPPDVAAIQTNGRSAYLEEQRFESRDLDAGGLPVGTWELGAEDRAALRRLVQDVQAGGATAVLVDMPVTNEYVQKHPHGERDYDTYQQALVGLAADLGVALVDLSSMRDHRWFADEVHMNVWGAHEFTRQLVDRLSSSGVVGGRQRGEQE